MRRDGARPGFAPPPEKQSSPEEASRIATILAADVLKAWSALVPIADPVLRFGRERVALDLADLKPGDVEWATQVAATFGSSHAAPMMDFVQAQKILELTRARAGRSMPRSR